MFSHRTIIRFIYSIIIMLCIAATAGILLLLQTKEYVFEQAIAQTTEEEGEALNPFPVSVDPINQTIGVNESAELYAIETLAIDTSEVTTWWKKAITKLSRRDWYQNLASPVSRIVVIWPGERKEEITKHIGDILRWDATEREEFISIITTDAPVLGEGKFYPGQYVAHRGATPQEVAQMILDDFNEEILVRYTPEVAKKVPLEDALTIASLLEREASDFDNMREISGVIWNRLFIDMPLQLDATLQYVRGARGSEKNWWPVPRPADKFLTSPYNTYANKGLPPGPIGNPSSEAVLAALNPIITDCYYYFHDSNQDYFCSVTYEEHVTKLKAAYGRGK